MKLRLLTLFFSIAYTTLLFAQPINDDCSGLIDLGGLPVCTDDIYDNVDATASDIGFGNIPTCFNGGTVQNDVWFSFTTNDTLIDVTIALDGTSMGDNGSIINPQIAVYRGDCSFNNLADLGICISAAQGETAAQLDVLGLTPNTTYFIRINDYSASATPNWGDFMLCVEEFVPAVNIGDSESSTSCFGTLFDSGGPDDDYQNGENLTFTINPSSSFGCLEISLVDFIIENGFDNLNFYAGLSTADPLIASFTGNADGSPITIQSSGPITVQFTSDGSVTTSGFELTWQCNGLSCDGSSVDNPTPISGLPFDGGYTTCNEAATLLETPCGSQSFMNGPDHVFTYATSGGFCADIIISDASGGTGVLVLSGPPGDPNTTCIGQSEAGTLFGVDFSDAGTYYIIVANDNGCTDFDLSITEADCNLNPSLLGALCNPLNGCIDVSGLPSVFNFNQGFEDVAYNQGINSGCWLNTGAAQPNYYWFTIEAQASGPFGFTVQAANPAEDSDIDFNVWGPFDPDEVCDDPDSIVDFIENNQPIRSSWAGGADPTGLADIHPVLGIVVEDEYDCGGVDTPGAGGDDFVRTIDCEPGEVYAVLINDWQDNIESGAIEVDWSASADSVLAPVPIEVLSSDTAICSGESVQLLVESSVSSITWIKDTATLSCLNCFDPLANPLETTEYVGVVDAVCYEDTVNVLVEVYNVDAGPDATTCLNEEIQIIAGSNFSDAEYTWTAPDEVDLSCTDCPDPFITSTTPGIFELIVTLAAPICTLNDTMTLEVLPQEAAMPNVADNQQLCIGESANLGGESVDGIVYDWTSDPPGFFSNLPDPEVTPDTTTTYYISATNGLCPLPSLDSVLVEVFLPPLLPDVENLELCLGDTITLSDMMPEGDVDYLWSGPPNIGNPSNLNSQAVPQFDGSYLLNATRGACEEETSFEVAVTSIAVDIVQGDTLRICRGTEVNLVSDFLPPDSLPLWTADQPGFEPQSVGSIVVAPETQTTYYNSITVDACFRIDSIIIIVDSLPADLSIMPIDTSVCEEEIVVFSSEIFEPSDFPDIAFAWRPFDGLQTPDTLYNLVITAPVDTITYERVTTNGVCADTSFVTVNVKPTPQISVMPVDTIICEGESVQLMTTISDDTEGVEWTQGGGSLSCTDCLDPVATPSSTSTYTVEATNEECPAQVSVEIQVVSLPAVALTPQTFLCEGGSVVLNELSDPNSTYIWTSTDPDFGTVLDPQPLVSPSQNTTYFLAATNDACDTLFEEITIEIVQEPSLSVGVSEDLICEGEAVTLIATVVNSTPLDTYTWVDEQGVEVASGVEPTIVINQEGMSTYTLLYESGAGCSSLSASVMVEVLPAPSANVSEDTIICLGEFVQLNSESDEQTAYNWTSTDPSFTQTSEPQPVVTPTQTATYTLVATNGICDDLEQSITVEVVGAVTLDITGPLGTLCGGDEASLVANTTGGSSGDQFSWVGSNGTTFAGDSITIMPEDTTVYTLTYITGANCDTLVDTYTVNVEPGVFPAEIVVMPELPGGATFFFGDTVLLTAVYETLLEELNLSWLEDTTVFASGINLFDTDLILLPEMDTVVNVNVNIVSPEGCVYALATDIPVSPPRVDVPNVFSPNEDGVNDFFDIVAEANRGFLRVTSFQVFNRWGQLIYDNDTPETGWDGRFNDQPQPVDVYFYQISVDYHNGQRAGEFQGNVTILR